MYSSEDETQDAKESFSSSDEEGNEKEEKNAPATPTKAAKRQIYAQIAKLAQVSEEDFVAKEDVDELVLALENVGLEEALDKMEDEMDLKTGSISIPKKFVYSQRHERRSTSR